MSENEAPRPSQKFDLVNRSMEEADQVLRSLHDDNSRLTWGTALAPKEMAEAAAQELEIRKMWAGMILPVGKFSALGDVEQLAREGFESILKSVIPGPDVLETLQKTLAAQEREMSEVMKTFRMPSISTEEIDACNGHRREMARFAAEFNLGPRVSDTIAKEFSAISSISDSMKEALKYHAQSIALDQTLAMQPIRMTPMFPREKQIIREKETIREKEIHHETKTFVYFVGVGQTRTDDTPSSSFYRDGKRWVISFNGLSVSDDEYKGYLYITFLLRNPLKGYAAWDLYKAVEGIGDQDPVSSYQPKMDAKLLEEFRKTRTRLCGEIREAEHIADEVNLERLRTELDLLEEAALSAVTPSGGSSRFADERELARKSVRNAVGRALLRLESIHPNLHQHLRSTLHLSPQYVYCPEHPISWEL